MDKGQAAAKELSELGEVVFHPLDVKESANIERLKKHVDREYGRLDVLVNNAGVYLDGNRSGEPSSAFDAKIETVRATVETNTYGPFQLCQALIPIMRKNNYGRVVNVSSGMGQLSAMGGGWPGYRISKTALNAVTRIFAEELKGTNILVNSVCPGWVRTDMGGPQATRTVEQGAETIVWLATLPDGGPTGGFFRDKQEIPW
jgi:NAD(P)-dependent dehydrogenase (short-subunit alcohol dehydrogenase family)